MCILGPPYCGIGATIRIGREIQCLHQKLAILSFIQIEEKRLEQIQGDSALLQVDPLPVDTVAGHILPGGLSARTRAEQVTDLKSEVDL